MTLKKTAPHIWEEDGTAWRERMIGDAGVFIVRVNEVDQTSGEIRGEYCNTELGSVGRFESYFHLFRAIQSELDRVARPQRASEQRSFKKRTAERLPADADLETLLPTAPPPVRTLNADSPLTEARGRVPGGRCALFFLRVIFRQNASWQGHLYWSDKKNSSCFRSIMELAELMDEAVRLDRETPE
ncbi:MAG: hypothetical protein EOM52_00615 [Clostridia bacterium]|nr:hypothetical protein [Clostridia bacterium]